jgi:methionyl aminopeptidase
MSIESPDDLAGLQRIGRIVALTLRRVRELVRPGVSTRELDEEAERFLASHGATPAPRLVYGFPGAIMISVNDEVVHSVPGERRIVPGDLVKIDVTAELNGYFCDAADTAVVAPVSALDHNLMTCARSAFRKAARAARAGSLVSEIGRAVETEVKRRGFTVLAGLQGHGVGRTIHEPPEVPNHFIPGRWDRLTEGLVLTIEPLISAGTSRVRVDRDSWTCRTADGSRAAHYEHTLVITRERPILLTQL